MPKLAIDIGALGTVSNTFHLYLNKVRLDGSMQPLQRAFRSLGTARNYYKKTDGWEWSGWKTKKTVQNGNNKNMHE